MFGKNEQIDVLWQEILREAAKQPNVFNEGTPVFHKLNDNIVSFIENQNVNSVIFCSSKLSISFKK